MTTPSEAVKGPPRIRVYHPLAGFLSYLVPGLGQIYQGRFGKGVLFMVCLLGMFFSGIALGQGKNVYLPDTAKQSNPLNLPTLAANIYNRPQFAGQVWIGVAAWPAIYYYNHPEGGGLFGDFERTPTDEELNEAAREGDSGKKWDLAWVYTVIAGVLNILVIYDAFAGPAFLPTRSETPALKEPSLA